MIHDLRRSHYQQLTLSFIAVFILGLFFGSPWLFVSISVIAYLSWNIYQQHKLISWLVAGARKTPPNANGSWGMIFDYLYNLQREHRAQVKNYRGVVQRMKASTEALADGIILLDETGNIQWWNAAAKDLLKLRPVDEGQLLTNLVREPKFVKFYNKATHREPITIENPAQINTYLQIAMSVFGKGERLLLLRDVTRVLKLEHMRQDFVSNASHELRTPLTVLKGQLENILTFADDLAPPIQKALTSMSNQTQRMNNLVTDLLLLTRLDSATEASQDMAINMPDFLQQIANDASDLSNDQNHNIILDLQCDCSLIGSPGEIRSAINNLVFNAVNYSPSNTDITITWKKIHQGAILSVTDQGTGIEQHHIPRLTERFYRADPGRSSEQGGTGLGLAIVKHSLQRHQARLDINSQFNKGSVFSCIFPEHRIVDLTKDPSPDEAEKLPSDSS